MSLTMRQNSGAPCSLLRSKQTRRFLKIDYSHAKDPDNNPHQLLSPPPFCQRAMNYGTCSAFQRSPRRAKRTDPNLTGVAPSSQEKKKVCSNVGVSASEWERAALRSVEVLDSARSSEYRLRRPVQSTYGGIRRSLYRESLTVKENPIKVTRCVSQDRICLL